MTKLGFGLALLLSSLALPSLAAETWDELRHDLFGERPLNDGADVIAIDAPYRTHNDSRTDIAAHVAAPSGLQLGKVMLILDENPMPVSAVFEFDKPMPRFFFDLTMRINRPMPLHVVAETTDGQLFVAETYVKTSGQGACAAPPGTDPELALQTLGNMDLVVGEAIDALMETRRVDVEMQHPSHSGLQMDQISLLYIPMRYVDQLAVDLDGAGYVNMTGSISLSENPRVGLSVPGQTQSVDVTMTDTDGTVSHAHKRLAGF